MTSPIPTSVATTAKSTASGGAARTSAPARDRPRRRAPSCGRVSANGRTKHRPAPASGHRRGEPFAAVFGRRKHVERRARRREQHDVAGRTQVARPPDRILHRRSVRNGNAFARALDVAGSFADRNDRLCARADTAAPSSANVVPFARPPAIKMIGRSKLKSAAIIESRIGRLRSSTNVTPSMSATVSSRCGIGRNDDTASRSIAGLAPGG